MHTLVVSYIEDDDLPPGRTYVNKLVGVPGIARKAETAFSGKFPEGLRNASCIS